MLYGAWQLIGLLWSVTGREWLDTAAAAGVTLLRVLVSTALGTLWAVPAGLAIGCGRVIGRWRAPPAP